MDKIQKADAAARKKAVVLVSMGALLGAGLISFIQMYRSDLIEWIETNATTTTQIPSVVVATFTVLFAPLYFAIYYLFSLGSRIAHAERFPPPGQAVVRDTRIITGDPAVMRGRILQMLSVAMAVTVTVVIFLMWHVLNEITSIS